MSLSTHGDVISRRRETAKKLFSKNIEAQNRQKFRTTLEQYKKVV